MTDSPGDVETLGGLVEGGQFAEALELGLAMWAATPDPRLADVVAKVSERVPTAAVDKPWKAEDAEPGSVPLGTLLAALLPCRRSGDLAERAEALAFRAADPRIGVALEGLLRAVPFTSNTARPNLARVFEAVARVAKHDPRFAGITATLDVDWDVRAAQREWMEKRFAPLAAAIDARWPTVPRIDGSDTLNALLASLDTVDPDSLEGQYAKVYEGGHDIAPRAVLMDALLEAGDPHGEFLSLQLNDGDSKRQKALLKAHAKDWLGELAGHVDVTEWRNGFPYAGKVDLNHPRDVTRLAPDPRWRTFGALEITTSPVKPHYDDLLAKMDGTLKSLRSRARDAVARIPACASALEELDLSVIWAEGEVLNALELPALRHLRLVGFSSPGWVKGAGWLDQLVSIDVERGRTTDLCQLWPTLAERPNLERFTGFRLRFDRGSDGRLSVLTLQTDPPGYQDPDRRRGHDTVPEALAMLSDGALTEIHVQGDKRPEWDSVVEALIARQSRLKCAVVRGTEHTFEREGAFSVTASVPPLGTPQTLAAGEAGIWARAGNFLLRIDPETQDTVDHHEVGPGGPLEVGEELAWADTRRVCWNGRWLHDDGARFLRFGASRLLSIGRQVRVRDAEGTILCEYSVGSVAFTSGDLSPDGTRIALCGYDTKLRIVPVEGGRAKLVGAHKQTRTAAWTPAGIWLSSTPGKLQLLSEDGKTEHCQIDFEPFLLTGWGDGVVACSGSEVLVLDGAGAEVLRLSATRAWPAPGGLYVYYRRPEPRFEFIALTSRT